MDDLVNKAMKTVVLRGNLRALDLDEAGKLFIYIYEGKLTSNLNVARAMVCQGNGGKFTVNVNFFQVRFS